MKTRKCSKCRKTKPTSEFYKDRRGRDGLRAACKACRKKAKAAYRKSAAGRRTRKARRKKLAESGYRRYGKGALATLRRSASRRGLLFDLTAEQLTQWWKNTPDNCAYCGQSIQEFVALRKTIIAYRGDNWGIARFKKFFRNKQYVTMRWLTIDRTNNSKGYTVKNLAKACWICNSLKHDFFSPRDMKRISPGLIKQLRQELAKENKAPRSSQ
jgi:hypothetical protein